ncbi:DUF445 domain-containing protein [Candidatus Uabimicrobium sp. HlEnr_7]|uniref:DUF445 domain-containing protein n=1 Tax=Candidatus Uabimicrobium helgolandensis TaxID=3095367 RepID=UPI003558DC1B
MRIFTPCCLLLFTLSFLWNPHQIVRSCSIAGLIGFGTNWIAVKMLFWPRYPRPIFGHGLIPSQRDDLVEKITCEVSEKLINEELIRQKIENSGILQRITSSLNEKLKELTTDKEFQEDTKKLLSSYIVKISEDANFREQVKSISVSKLENVVGKVLKKKLFTKINDIWKLPLNDIVDRIINKVSELLISIIEDMDIVLENIPHAIDSHREAIEGVLLKTQMGLIQEIDIRKIITTQLQTISAEQLEQGFREFSDDKLTFITLLGGVLGFIGGFVIIWPTISIAVMIIIVSILICLDRLIGG